MLGFWRTNLVTIGIRHASVLSIRHQPIKRGRLPISILEEEEFNPFIPFLLKNQNLRHYSKDTDKEEIYHDSKEEDEGIDKIEGKVPQDLRDKDGNIIRDPSKQISYETSIRYMQSDAYKETYGDKKVWVLYRRNFKGQFPPKKTRGSCFIFGKLNTGNPCPICRDEYLVLDYRNVELLKQFISPYNGEILKTNQTNLCREMNALLLIEIQKAKEYGTILFDVPFRKYNYEEYYPKEKLDKLKEAGVNF